MQIPDRLKAQLAGEEGGDEKKGSKFGGGLSFHCRR